MTEPKFYTSIQSGVAEHKNGGLLIVDEILLALDYCTDNDELLPERVGRLIKHLQRSKNE